MDVDLGEVSDDWLLYVLGYYVYTHVSMRSLTREEVPGTNVTYQDVMAEANQVRGLFAMEPEDMLNPVFPEPEEEVVQHEEPLVIDPLV